MLQLSSGIVLYTVSLQTEAELRSRFTAERESASTASAGVEAGYPLPPSKQNCYCRPDLWYIRNHCQSSRPTKVVGQTLRTSAGRANIYTTLHFNTQTTVP